VRQENKKKWESFISSPFSYVALSFLFLALACYALISLCHVRGTENGHCKVKLIMAVLVIFQSHLFSNLIRASAEVVTILESFWASPARAI
jgi:hypothetical protein